MEIIISNFRFAKCSNTKCNSVYSFDIAEVAMESEKFCPKCRIELLHSHLVQCEHCQSVINFVPSFSNEEAVVFYVDKCLNCSGTIKDEKHLTPHYFPKAFI